MGFFEQIGEGVGKTIDVTTLANNLFSRVWPWIQQRADEETPRLEAWAETWAEAKANAIVDQYTPLIVERLLAILPTVAASAAKVAVEKMVEGIPNLPNFKLPDVGELTGEVLDKVLDSDPDIPGLSDIIDVSELFRKWREGIR
jgi:hypothetical protein